MAEQTESSTNNFLLNGDWFREHEPDFQESPGHYSTFLAGLQTHFVEGIVTNVGSSVPQPGFLFHLKRRFWIRGVPSRTVWINLI